MLKSEGRMTFILISHPLLLKFIAAASLLLLAGVFLGAI
jgi:hypothetical protein